MSYETAIDQSPNAFEGGYIDNLQDIKLPDDKSPYLRNVRIDGEAISNRPGHALFGELLGGTGIPKGIGAYLRPNTDDDRLIVRQNVSGTQKLISINENGIQTNITTGSDIVSDNNMNFTSIGDNIYCMNGSDLYGKLSGTTYTIPTPGIVGFAPNFGIYFNGAHWVSGWGANSNTLYKSATDDPDNFSTLDADSYTFPDIIVGEGGTKEAMFVFTRDQVHRITDSSIQDVGGTLVYGSSPLEVRSGSAGHRSIVSFGKHIYYLTPSNKIKRIGIAGGGDFDPIELSHRNKRGINKIMKTLDSDQSKACAYALEQDNLIKWCVKTKGKTYNDLCITYDVEEDEFLIDNNKPFSHGVYFKNQPFTISEFEKKVFEDEKYYIDDNAEIVNIYHTKRYSMNKPTRIKELWEALLICEINALARLTQEILVDGIVISTRVITAADINTSTNGIGTGEIASEQIGGAGGGLGLQEFVLPTYKGNLQVKGRFIQFRFTCRGKGARFLLKILQFRLELLPEEAN